MTDKIDRGCRYNRGMARRFGVILCDSKPEYQDYCLKHIPYTLKLQREYDLTSMEDRQKYLDLLHSGNSIGEAREKAGISFEAAIEITNKSIRSYKYLAKEASE